jgi:hypothetical protein
MNNGTWRFRRPMLGNLPVTADTQLRGSLYYSASQLRFAPRQPEIIKYPALGMDGCEIPEGLDRECWTVRNYVWSIRKQTGGTAWLQMVSWSWTMYGEEGVATVMICLYW